MSKKNKKHIILGVGAPCPKCNGRTQIRKGTDGGKSFYFSQYDYCRPCVNVIFNEKYKVFRTEERQIRNDQKVYNKAHRKPERVKTENEIAKQKRAYAQWRKDLNNVMKSIT
jgi:ssDNA-binding Zn-finger/Zn-ribbon topoisomerase 1